jgi:hypothetical protein
LLLIIYSLWDKGRWNWDNYLNTWFVQTMTDCWLESWLSRTCNTTWTQIKSPLFSCILNSSIQDLSWSDCVTANKKWVVMLRKDSKRLILLNVLLNYDSLILCFICASLMFSQWISWYQETPFSSSFVKPKWNSPL